MNNNSINNFDTWEYEDQTKMKHLVFSDYFDKWVIILNKYHQINFIDGFGGIGAYKENNEIKWGSPILATNIIVDNCDRYGRDIGKCFIVIIDNVKKNLDNVQKILNHLNLKVNVNFIQEDFDKAINKILDESSNIAPTFFLVDPFGFKIKMKTIQRLMSIDKSEILVNFMYSGITRNLDVSNAKLVLNELFGCEEWKNYKNLLPEQKEKCLVELYKKQMKKFSKFVSPFRFSFPDKSRTYYYLFHATNHIKGCSIMKACFAKHNNGRNEYLGEYGVQKTLLDVDDVKISEIKEFLLNHFKNKEISFIQLLEEILDMFSYTESEYIKALKSLELENKIRIIRTPTLTKTGKKRNAL